jgi:hypothetical protein
MWLPGTSLRSAQGFLGVPGPSLHGGHWRTRCLVLLGGFDLIVPLPKPFPEVTGTLGWGGSRLGVSRMRARPGQQKM